MSSSSHSAIVLFYKYFVPGETPSFFHHHVDHYVDQLVQFQRDLCHKLELKGRLLVAPEGINGTLSGATASVIQEYIREMKNWNIRNDCPLPPPEAAAAAVAGQGGGVNAAADASAAIAENKTDAARLFAQVDWKESSVDDDDDDNDDPLEPFPDLKISIVKEIVSTGGLVRAEEVTTKGGRHLTPREFHQVLVDDSTTDTTTGTDTGKTTTGTKPVVLVDVRNTFEHDIGHFVHPNSGLAAMNPEMVTFSSFDTNFCAKYANELKDKKVLMYCTGGIRCEKASVMLKNRGVEDVNQLQGGIHRYLEAYGNQGHYKGLNFVFDQRVAMKPSNENANNENANDEKEPHHHQNEIVGRCIECTAPFDEICGSRVCTVCRDLVLVCPSCQSKLREYHCKRHSSWKDCYFTFLEIFDTEELQRQHGQLVRLRESLTPPAEHKNRRRTLLRQVEKGTKHMARLKSGQEQVHREAPLRCRTCMEVNTICDGRCWGFWKTRASAINKRGEKRKPNGLAVVGEDDRPALPVAVGDQVEPGENWNVLRLGDKSYPDGRLKRGEVVEVKSWAGDGNDCVAVMWDHPELAGGNQRNKDAVQPQIHRWGVVALDGSRMYDLRRIEAER